MLHVILAAFVYLLLSATTLSSLVAQNLSPVDSVDIRVVAVIASLDSFNVRPDTGRIWLHTHDSLHQGDDGYATSESVTAKVRVRFPTARPARGGESFLCPPGVEVRMPGRGCPIRDNGVIIAVGRLYTIGETVRLEVSLIQTSRGLTWAAGHTLILVRSGYSWTVLKVTDRFIT